MRRPLLLLVRSLLAASILSPIDAATIPAGISIASDDADPDLTAIKALLPNYKQALARMASDLTSSSNNTSLNGTHDWPPAPFNLPSRSFPSYSLHIRSYSPAYLTVNQMYALAALCIDEIQHYMDFDDIVPWPTQTTIFRPTRHGTPATYREDVEIALFNIDSVSGTPFRAPVVVRTLNIILNMVLAGDRRTLERQVAHYFVGHPCRAERGGLLIFKKVQLRARTDRIGVDTA
ncbi:MAG: hypothetical protein Q9218_003247 [Villophora microphyllina]